MTTHRLGQGSKWRQYQRAAQTAVLCDSLAEAGLWPWRFYGGWRNLLKEVFGEIQWLEGSLFGINPDETAAMLGQAINAPPTMTGLLAFLQVEINRPPQPIGPLFVSPRQYLEYERMLPRRVVSREELAEMCPPLVVTRVDHRARVIDIATLRPEPEEPPKQRGRVPGFIPVRRLDGRR